MIYKIEEFMPYLDTIIDEGLITMEKVRVIAYRHNLKDSAEKK